MSSEDAKTYSRRLSLREKLHLVDLINKNVTPMDNGTCKYSEGWSDARVAAESNIHPLNVAQVQAVRREMFGKLYYPPAPPEPPVGGKYAKLERRIEQLEKTVRLILTGSS